MLYVGGTAVIQQTFDPVQTFNLLEKEKISLFFGVPAIFLALIQHPDFKADIFQGRSPGHERRGASAGESRPTVSRRSASPSSKGLA